MRSTLRVRIFSLLVFLLSPGPLLAQKTLHWRRLDVAARLDAQGVLHVAERQAIVFNGDWNGGERTFRLEPGQSVRVLGVSRQDPETGSMRALKEGSLSELDHYALTDAKTLRWRSRLPSDPPFDKTEILYQLDYELSGILAREGDSYVLNHDFAFPDRSGTIEAFSLELAFDPVWKPDRPMPARYEQGPLPPGQSVVVRRKLGFSGEGKPTAARLGTSRGERRFLFLVFLAAMLALGAAFYRREAALGRFTPPPREDIDAAWLEKNVFSLRPEEVGALWDDEIGAPEVAAVLARLSAEKKIATEAEGKKLTMRLLVPLSGLDGYEKDLLEAFFFGGRKETDTDSIREHYRSKGFDPASKIRGKLEERLAAHPDFRDRSPRPPRLPTALLALSSIVLMAAAVLVWRADPGVLIGTVFSQGLLWGIGFFPAYFFQKRVRHFFLPALGFLWVPAVLLYSSYRGIALGATIPLLALVGIFLMRVAIVNNLFNLAKTRSGPHRIARRKTLVAARTFFAGELASPNPRLEDAWFPYLVAFGLAGGVEKWFRAFGGEQAAAARPAGAVSSSRGSASSGSPSGGWTGGGGSFGGAGASASWAVAAGALAAGVSAPSSGGSGGGGGGGGGGSSGGGGGGGW